MYTVIAPTEVNTLYFRGKLCVLKLLTVYCFLSSLLASLPWLLPIS
jgi:hypothetical protein